MGSSEDFIELLRQAQSGSGMGVLAFEHSLDMKGGALKAILDPKQNQMPRLDKAERIAKALGLEFYIGPPRNCGQAPAPVAVLDLAPPRAGRHWMVPDADPPPVVFFHAVSDFATPAEPAIFHAGQYGLAERADWPVILSGDTVLVQRSKDRGLNLGMVESPSGPGVTLRMTGRAGAVDHARDQILAVWRVTWWGITPPSSLAQFVWQGVDTTVNHGTLTDTEQKVRELQARVEKFTREGEALSRELEGLNDLLPRG